MITPEMQEQLEAVAAKMNEPIDPEDFSHLSLQLQLIKATNETLQSLRNRWEQGGEVLSEHLAQLVGALVTSQGIWVQGVNLQITGLAKAIGAFQAQLNPGKVRIARAPGKSRAIIPKLAKAGDACFDLQYIPEDGIDDAAALFHQTNYTLPTGLIFEIPPGFELQIRPRSGLAAQALTVLNSPGTIDSGYRGEVLILVRDIRNAGEQNSKPFVFKPGDRIAQACIKRVVPVEFEMVDAEELSKTERGEGGFGHTGLEVDDAE